MAQSFTDSQMSPTPAPSPVGAKQEGHKHLTVTIGKPPEEVYAFWRDFSNLASFMKDIAEIRVLSPERSHWVVKLKSGPQAEWDAVITAEQPGKMISWKSVPGSTVATEGTVWFAKAPADLGTVVSLSLMYDIPGGKLTEFLTMFKGEDPQNLILTNLRRLKAVMETGEYPTTEGQPSGRDEDAEEILKH